MGAVAPLNSSYLERLWPNENGVILLFVQMKMNPPSTVVRSVLVIVKFDHTATPCHALSLFTYTPPPHEKKKEEEKMDDIIKGQHLMYSNLYSCVVLPIFLHLHFLLPPPPHVRIFHVITHERNY